VLVRVRAASLNYPDLLMTQGSYQFKPEPPFVSGLEMAGEVVEAPADSGFVPGDRVRGGAKTGAFAEYVALPAAALRKVPEAMDFAHADQHFTGRLGNLGQLYPRPVGRQFADENGLHRG
jgi:NADPH2:quinone reductase